MTEASIRLGAFLGVFSTMAAWELFAPWRRRQDRAGRWPANLGLIFAETVLVRILVPLSAAGAAMLAEARGWGAFNALGAPWWLAAIASMALLDLSIYAQHVAFHRVPALWRLHRMHHSDRVVDVTTGLRFHPLEIALSLLVKIAAVIALGAPAAAVIAFEALLNAAAMFNHANVALPPAVDRLVRLLVVTPAMHRIHHSERRHETDSNFGFALPWWDRLFGTYRAQPEGGEQALRLGLGQFDAPEERGIVRMLTQPFRDR